MYVSSGSTKRCMLQGLHLWYPISIMIKLVSPSQQHCPWIWIAAHGVTMHLSCWDLYLQHRNRNPYHFCIKIWQMHTCRKQKRHLSLSLKKYQPKRWALNPNSCQNDNNRTTTVKSTAAYFNCWEIWRFKRSSNTVPKSIQQYNATIISWSKQ